MCGTSTASCSAHEAGRRQQQAPTQAATSWLLVLGLREWLGWRECRPPSEPAGTRHKRGGLRQAGIPRGLQPEVRLVHALLRSRRARQQIFHPSFLSVPSAALPTSLVPPPPSTAVSPRSSHLPMLLTIAPALNAPPSDSFWPCTQAVNSSNAGQHGLAFRTCIKAQPTALSAPLRCKHSNISDHADRQYAPSRPSNRTFN